MCRSVCVFLNIPLTPSVSVTSVVVWQAEAEWGWRGGRVVGRAAHVHARMHTNTHTCEHAHASLLKDVGHLKLLPVCYWILTPWYLEIYCATVECILFISSDIILCVCGCLSVGKTEALGKNPAEKSPARGAVITGLYYTCVWFVRVASKINLDTIIWTMTTDHNIHI